MTTIAWTRGCFASDSCITHTDENAMPGHRTLARKLKTHPLKSGKGGVRMLALASKGATVVATALDGLVIEQASAILASRGRTPFEVAMNRPALLKKRREIINENDVGQLLTCWRDQDESCYLIENSGIVQLVEEPYIAIGWDSAAAYGSLRAGKDALFAVESASLYGCYTAKPIHYLQRGLEGIELKVLT